LGKSMKCGMGTFRWDPALNVSKARQFLKVPLDQLLVKVEGYYQKLLTCSGCSQFEFETTTGVSIGKETVKSTEWGDEFTAAAETTFKAGIMGVGSNAKTSFSLAQSRSSSESVASSFTQGQSDSKTLTFEKGALYQFVTSVDEYCAAGICKTIARSNCFICQAGHLPPPVSP
jgi:hypothetical protein